MGPGPIVGARMKGELVAFHLFDVGGSFDLAALERTLAHRKPAQAPAIGKGTPAYVEFPRPLVVAGDSLELRTPLGPLKAQVSLLYFPLGAVSVRFRLPFEVEQVAKLGTWNQSTAHVNEGWHSLEDAARALLEKERSAWEPCVRDRYTEKILNESYTAFAFQDVGEPAASFLNRHKAEVAGLLKGEDSGRLHSKEVEEALKRWWSYYEDDAVVIDWDAAFIVDPSAEYEDLLFVLEIANLQLLEFRAYDDYLDDVIARSYDELERLFRAGTLFRSARKTAHELSLIRLEMAELADETDNITKFLGDWFLARVYASAQEKFHLAAWRATVDEKLATMHQLYQLATTESDNRRLLTLELLIVLLFVLDLAVIVFK